MIVVPGQRPRTVAIAPQAGTEGPIGLTKKGQHQRKKKQGLSLIPCHSGLSDSCGYPVDSLVGLIAET
jgi:hypothetical protein